MRQFSIKALAVGFAFAGVLSTGAAQEITGAGATFPAPLYAKWADAYNKATGVRINYQSVGSGAGLRQIRGKTVDFGASDMPLTDEELQKDGLTQFPTVIGGVVPVFNIPGIATRQMKLSGQVLGDIYLGKITKWNDPAIVALNPGVKLPDAQISPVRRADGSGTTFIFTNYLSKVNPEWKTKVGEGTAVNWPVGCRWQGQRGRLGIRAAPAELDWLCRIRVRKAEQDDLRADAELRRRIRRAGGRCIQSGRRRCRLVKDVLSDPDQSAGKDSWPITGATFIMMQLKQDKPQQAAASLKFFDWAYANGDKMADELDYVPLPDSVEALIRQQWSKITDTAGKPVYTK